MAGAWTLDSMQCDPMPEAPVPEVYRLHAKGWRPGTALFVDTDNGRHVVQKELHVEEVEEG